MKHYSILAPIDACDYDKNEDIFDTSLPCWIKKEMRKVAKMEKVNIRRLSFERKLIWDNDDHKWLDMVEIIKY